MVRRRDAWFDTKDRGSVDEEGYFYHAGRADDVIISAGLDDERGGDRGHPPQAS
jgi:acyl-coenzyme A synthetase/AMP-(fatty) acid ligase